MKEAIERILAELDSLQAKSHKEVEDARVRFLGKKGEITQLFEEFRGCAPELKREFGQKLNDLKKAATAKIEELKDAAEAQQEASAP
ncbi:MAG: phenylalanine--tRNA ligase subunit alpha, partial [Bacteroidales bacterium]|nr:phenylalanine--tRNA ligase subunit alpha [Bacteroidales bacterium]